MAATVLVEVQKALAIAGVPPDVEIQACLEATFRRVQPDEARDVEIVVRVVDEEEGRALNLQFRQQNKATNVLSFPAAADALPDEFVRSLGDIVICGPVVEREAVEQGKAEASHWYHLLVHGTLHLLGFDHATAVDAATMESLEIEILANHGIADPYHGL